MSLNMKTLTQALAKTAAVIEKTVTTTVQEVTGPRALQDYDLLDQIGTAGPALAWRLYSARPKTKPSLGLQYPLVCVWILDKKALTEARTRAGLSKATEDAFLDIVRADAGKLVRIRHPGIVHVVQALDETKTAMAMVTEPLFASVANVLGNHVNMEKVPRELKGLEMSVLEIKHGLLQLAESLDFLHTNARLVHRAISPEAVFITSSGAWKLGGFGFAAPVDQNAGDPNSVHPFHYPEYDVEDSLLPLQPSLNYTAPELVRSKSLQCGFSCDVFSLGCVAYHLLSHKPLLDCNNNVKMYMNRLTYLSHEAFSSIPVDLVADLQRMLSIDETFRPTALNFSASPFFRDDTRLRALRFLDHMLERDNMQKTEFLKALSEMWKDFDSRVLRYKVLPPLCAELRNVVMQPMILPMVLTIAESQDKTEFELYTLPALMPVLTSATGDTLFLLVKHAELIMIKATSDHIVSHLLPLFVRAYEDNDVRIQEEVLRSTIFLAKQLDLQLMKSSILPRVHALALRTTVAVVRVNALVCLGDLITVIDKNAAQEILQTLQRCTAVDRSAPTLMCTLGVANAMLKEYGVEFAAEHVLPLLVPLLTAQQLNVQQFGKFMFFVKDILRRIEEKRGVVVNDLGTKSGGVSNPASNGHKPLQKLGGHTQSSNKSVTAWDEDWSSVSKGSTPHLQPKSDVLLKPSIPPSMLTSSSTQPHESISPPVPQVSPSYAAASDFEWPPPGRAPNPATQAVGYKKPQATSKSNPVNDVEWPPAPSTTQGIPATGYENSKLTASGSSESNLSFDDPFASWPPRSTNTGSSNVSTSDHSVQYPMQNLGRPISSTSNLNSSTNGSVDLSRLYEQKNLSDVSLLSSGTSIGQLKSSQLHLGAVVGPKSDKKEVNFGSTFLSSDSLHKTLKIAPPPPAGIGAGRGGKLQGRSPATASSRSEKRNADRGQARPLDLL